MTATVLYEMGRGEVGSGEILRAVPLTPGEVGARIASAREEMKPKPWSQFDLALALGVSPSTVYRWEKGKLPSVNELIRLADVLEKPADYFTEPPERQLELADLRQEIQALRDHLEQASDEVERRTGALVASLGAIDARLSRIEELLAAQVAQAKSR